MTKQEVDKPFIVINDVLIYAEDLPAESQGIFSRLKRLMEKKKDLTLDLGENQASINFFSGVVVAIFNKSNSPSVEADEDSIEKSNN